MKWCCSVWKPHTYTLTFMPSSYQSFLLLTLTHGILHYRKWEERFTVHIRSCILISLSEKPVVGDVLPKELCEPLLKTESGHIAALSRYVVLFFVFFYSLLCSPHMQKWPTFSYIAYWSRVLQTKGLRMLS